MTTRFITFSAFAVALVALFACNKEQEINVKEPTSPKGIRFEIVAGTPETKTVNDGMSTNWVANDAITLFHVETGEDVTDACDNDEFTISSENLAAKKFTGTLTTALDGAKSYDWYAIYPKNTATDLSSVTLNFFSSSDTRTASSGYDDVAHLAGTNMPLVGRATNVAAATKPSLSMDNLATVIKIEVTNNSGKALTITSVSITAPEKIVGKFTANLNNFAAPVYTPDGTYSYSTAILKINGGTSIADGGSQTFYIPVKPFTLAEDADLSIKVNTYTKTITNTSGSAIAFNAGEIKKMTFNYDKVFVSQNFTHATSIANGDKVIFTNGTSGSVKTMGHYASGSNIASVDGTIAGGILASTSSMGIYTVAYDSETGYTFYDPETETYLNATSTTSSNTLKGIADLDSYSYWTVSFDEGAAVVTNKGKASRNIIRCNSTGTPFTAYTSGQSPIYLFKYDSRTPVTLTFANTSISKTTSNYTEFTGQYATVSPSVSPITYAMTGDAIGTVNSSTGAVILNGTAGTATVTATFAGSVTHIGATASYTITVSSVAPPTTGSILFSCDFGSTNNLAFADYTGGTSWNNASTLTYSVSDNSKVFISTSSAGNMTSGNLYFNGKNNSAGYTATIAGIKTYGATNVTVFWAANNASSDLEVTGSSTAKTTSANSASNRQVFALTGSEETISLVFSNNAAANTRVDNVVVKFGSVTE